MNYSEMTKQELIQALETKTTKSKVKTMELNGRTVKVKGDMKTKEGMKQWIEEDEKFTIIWKRAGYLESNQFFFFRRLSQTHNWYGKNMSEKQVEYLNEYYELVKDLDEQKTKV